MKDFARSEALFLPFMQIPTGHHHVADALMYDLQKNTACDKVDILSYSYGKAEGLVSSAYLKWIEVLPGAYDWLYCFLASKQMPKRNRQFIYEALFNYYLKKLVNEYDPTIMFFTHCLPSNIASVLKQKRKLDAVTVNVYTDYFVNRVWGIEGIDYHFVPSLDVKKFLLQSGVKEERIFLTGIPVHPAFRSEPVQSEVKNQINVLVTGGSLGVGAIDKLLPVKTVNSDINYYVLCGKNQALYRQLRSAKRTNITPIPYVSSKEKMNILYEMADAVITKPGGVTVSECLIKRKPIFVSGALPGQEKINLERLKQMGLIIPLDLQADSAEEALINYFADEAMRKRYDEKLHEYHCILDKRPIQEIMDKIMNIKKH